jgi:integrase
MSSETAVESKKVKRQPTKRVPFTVRSLEKLQVPTTGTRMHVYDTGQKDLGLRVDAGGRRTFFWFKAARGRPVFRSIGQWPAVSIAQARAKAAELTSSILRWKLDGYQGPNPLEKAERPLTVGEVFDRYVEMYLASEAKNPEHAMKYARWQFDRYLAALRSHSVGSIRKKDVCDLHSRLQASYGATTANRALQLLRAIINWAIAAELVEGENPAKGAKLSRETKRRRFLQAHELAALKHALDSPETGLDLRHYVLLALLTGARKSDVLSMKWENVDLDRKTWLVPQPKNREPYYVPLTDLATDILAERKSRAARQSPWVFPSRGASGHLVDLKRAWADLLKRAGIADLRQHDLRRTLGSWQAAGGASLSIIGKSLGHKSLGSTQIYAQLDLDPVRASVEAATRAMLTAATAKALPPTGNPGRG